MIIERQQAGSNVRIDTAGQVLSLDASPWSEEQIPLIPTIAKAIKPGAFVPAAAFAIKAMLFEEGLFATLELACQPSKQRLLDALVQTMSTHASEGVEETAGLLLAARRMSGRVDFNCQPGVEDQARSVTNDFLAEPERSEPFGFYAWSPSLTAIFRQDRLLTLPLSEAGGEALVHALREIPAQARATYDGSIRLSGLMANQASEDFVDLRRIPPGHPMPEEPPLRFMPPTRTVEGELSRRLFGDQNPPMGVNMMDVAVAAMRSGQVRFKPTPSTGWYEYLLWALETLLRPEDTPEGKYLEFSRDYRQTQEQLFRALITLSGEQAHNLPSTAPGGSTPWKPKMEIRPNLSLEPLLSFYYRRGMAYGFLRKVLESFFGPTLAGLKRLRADGPVQETLAVELAKMESLFLGAAEVVAEELELPLPTRPTSEQDVYWARHWMSDLGLDRDLSTDHRMMTPIRYEIKRRKILVLANLGYKVIPLSVGYAKRPQVTITDRDNQPAKVEPEFRAGVYDIVTPIVVQVSVPKMLYETEFRQVCAEGETEQEIIAKLCGY